MPLNPVDPKWLEILKASGWQITALTVACAVIAILVKYQIIPTTDNPLWFTLPVIGALIFGALSIAAICSELAKYINPTIKFRQWRQKIGDEKKVREYIQYMNEKERQIIGYLLYHKQKTFQAEVAGGYAATLISKGIIVQSTLVGQAYDPGWAPFEVPDHIWKVLVENGNSFPYEPPQDGEVERHPWAIPWMVR